MTILDGSVKMPLYAQLYEQIKADILSGRVKAGAKLVSSRKASGDLGVSRNTVELAYEQLFAEGFITSLPRKGYYVAYCMDFPRRGQSAAAERADGRVGTGAAAPDRAAGRKAADSASHNRTDGRVGTGAAAPASIGSREENSAARGRSAVPCEPGALQDLHARPACCGETAPLAGHGIVYDFGGGSLIASELPLGQWQKLVNKCFRDHGDGFARQSAAFGELGLRREIQKYIHDYRGVNCSAEQIVVAPGAQPCLALACQMLKMAYAVRAVAVGEQCGGISLATIRICGLEPRPMGTSQNDLGLGLGLGSLNPTGAAAVSAQAAAGAEARAPRIGARAHFPADAHTEISDAADARAGDRGGGGVCATAAYVAPSGLFQGGLAMPMPRRRELVEWACGNDAYIVEDDAGCQLRHGQIPLPSLQSMCADRVFYIGGFSDILFPGDGLSYLVIPRGLAECLREEISRIAPRAPFMSQKPLELFISEGYWESHLRRMAKMRKIKCELLEKEINRWFGDRAAVSWQGSGSQLLVSARWRATDGELVERARRAGVRVCPTPQCRQGLENISGGGSGSNGGNGSNGVSGAVFLNYVGISRADIPAAAARLYEAWLGA
jgi:GntR family transcriptional regulator/MocR family aminotransferase